MAFICFHLIMSFLSFLVKTIFLCAWSPRDTYWYWAIGPLKMEPHRKERVTSRHAQAAYCTRQLISITATGTGHVTAVADLRQATHNEQAPRVRAPQESCRRTLHDAVALLTLPCVWDSFNPLSTVSLVHSRCCGPKYYKNKSIFPLCSHVRRNLASCIS